MSGTPQSSSVVLCWPKRLLSADDLRRHLTSQRELLILPGTVITPLAGDELKAKGVRIHTHVPAPSPLLPGGRETRGEGAPKERTWCYAQEKNDAMIVAALKAVASDGT